MSRHEGEEAARKYQQAARKTVISAVSIEHKKAEDTRLPPHFYVGNVPQVDEVWVLLVTARTGLRAPMIQYTIFLTEEEAIRASEQYVVGSEMDEMLFHIGDSADERLANIRNKIDNDESFRVPTPANERLDLASAVLEVIGVIEPTEQRKMLPSQRVRELVGQARIDELQSRHGDAWQYAAELEYCHMHLPPSSPGLVAAACRYNLHVANDPFAAGYMLRDLEVLVRDMEGEAARSFDRGKKAAQHGVIVRRNLSQRRKVSLMEGMEEAAKRNPDIVAAGQNILTQFGLTFAKKSDPALWKTGADSVDQYVDDILGGAEGPELRARLLALRGRRKPRNN